MHLAKVLRRPLAISILSAVMVGACASTGTRVVTAYDPDADFSQFQTFQFVSPLSTDERGQRSTISVQLIAATTRELQARGMQPVSSGADLQIDFFAAQGNRTPGSGLTLATSHNHSGLSTWRSYNMRRVASSNITEGMVVVDVIDARRGALVFEGMAEARVTEDMRDNFSDSVRGAIADIFEEFP
jgi:hypothetical protein